jgi:hypothetical protein
MVLLRIIKIIPLAMAHIGARVPVMRARRK